MSTRRKEGQTADRRQDAADREKGDDGKIEERGWRGRSQKQGKVNHRIGAGVIAFIGYLLSPLSWWNDLFINLPLAYLFANLLSLASHRLFAPAMIAGYWATNVAGILMMAEGTAGVIGSDPRRHRRRQLLLSLAAATGYTLLILMLFRFGALRPLSGVIKR